MRTNLGVLVRGKTPMRTAPRATHRPLQLTISNKLKNSTTKNFSTMGAQQSTQVTSLNAKAFDEVPANIESVVDNASLVIEVTDDLDDGKNCH
jgi:hypothetical protein